MKQSTRQMLENHLYALNGELQEIERRGVPMSPVEKRRTSQDRIALLLSKSRVLASMTDIETSPVQATPATQYKLEIRHLSYDDRLHDTTKFASSEDLPAILEEYGTKATIKLTNFPDDTSRCPF